MDERIRVSDADRERVAERLREHFAEGRLTSDELEERIAAALTAKTVGDLRRPLADLPAQASVPGSGPTRAAVRAVPPRLARRGAAIRWRPHPLPLLLIAVVAAVLLPGTGALLVMVKIVALVWLLAIVAAISAIVRLGIRARRHWHEAQRQWEQDWPAYWRQAPHWHGRHWRGQHWHDHPWQSHRWQGDYSR